MTQGHCIKSLFSGFTDSNSAAAGFQAGNHTANPYSYNVTSHVGLTLADDSEWQIHSQAHSAQPSRVCGQEFKITLMLRRESGQRLGISFSELIQSLFLVMTVPILRKIVLFMCLVKK